MSRNIFALNRNKILVTHKQRNDLQAPFELSGGILVYRVVKVATFKTWFSNLICFKLPNYFMLFKREITLTIEKKSEEKLLKVLKTLIFESHENLNRWFRIETSISHGRCQVIGHCSKFWTRTSQSKKMNDKKESFAFLVGWSEWRSVWRSVWRSPPYFRPLIVFILLLSTYKLNVFFYIDKRFSSFLKWMELHYDDMIIKLKSSELS